MTKRSPLPLPRRYKYQCVEFARRWLIKAQGYTFGDVAMAFQIFDMKYAIRVSDGAKVLLLAACRVLVLMLPAFLPSATSSCMSYTSSQ